MRTFRDVLDVVRLVAIARNVLRHPDARGERRLQDVHLHCASNRRWARGNTAQKKNERDALVIGPQKQSGETRQGQENANDGSSQRSGCVITKGRLICLRVRREQGASQWWTRVLVFSRPRPRRRAVNGLRGGCDLMQRARDGCRDGVRRPLTHLVEEQD